MKEQDFKLDVVQRLTRQETYMKQILELNKSKASKDSVAYNKKLIFWMLGLMFALSGKVAIGSVQKRDFVEVRKQAEAYHFEITSEKPINNFQVMSCHRHFFQNKKTKWFKYKSNRKVTFDYKPVSIEKKFCPLHFGVFGKSGTKKLGFTDFESPSYKLTANLLCNGVTSRVNGVGVCQTRRNLTQRIYFNEEVKMYSSCIKQGKTAKMFDIKSAEDMCTYFFQDDDKNRARLTLLAYDRV